MTVPGTLYFPGVRKVAPSMPELIADMRYPDPAEIFTLLDIDVCSTPAIAANRAQSYYSKTEFVGDEAMGIGFYDFVSDMLENYDEKKEEFAANLKGALEYLFVKGKVIVNYGGSKESFEKIKELSKDFVEDLFDKAENDDPWEYEPEQKNEAFITPGQVQYVARAGKYDGEYDGSFFALTNIMRTEYLWNNIRVLGGAYGCMNRVSKFGDVIFTSYRDPNLKSTSDTYLNAADYIENFDVDERTLRKFIIGAISGVDRPLTTGETVARELALYITGNDYEARKKNRHALLNTSLEDIRKLGKYYREAMDKGNICVIGSKSAIEENKDMFKTIRNI